MTRNFQLTMASLLTILLMSLHVADDIVRGMEPGRFGDLVVVPILAVFLYGTLVLAERRAGYIIILLGSLLGLVIPIVHFRNPGGVAGGAVAASQGAFFFVWTQIAMGVTALFSGVLAARALWNSRRGKSR